MDFYRLTSPDVLKPLKNFFSGSPESGDDFEYLYYGEKIQTDNFKRVFSKNYVKKRSGPVFGRFKGGFLWDVSMVVSKMNVQTSYSDLIPNTKFNWSF